MQTAQESIQLADAADRIADLSSKLALAQKRIEDLEGKIGKSPTKKVDQPFSLTAEERRRRKRD